MSADKEYVINRYVQEKVTVKASSRQEALAKAEKATPQRTIQREDCHAVQSKGKDAENTISPVGTGVAPENPAEKTSKEPEDGGKKPSKKSAKETPPKKN